jgi:thiamine-phosphate pyrophosphorylase
VISLSQARLYGILDLGYITPDQLEGMTESMLTGGIDVIQLRAKTYDPEQVAAFARRVLPLCRDAGIPLIINDHLEVVLQVEADGVHLGQSDESAVDARKLLGPGRTIGLSTHTLLQARAGAREPVDYIAFGPLYATDTKPDYYPIGLDDIVAVHRQVDLPIFCIGGVKLPNLPQVLAAGARRVVIVSGILQAEDVVAYIQEVQALLRAAPHLEKLA